MNIKKKIIPYILALKEKYDLEIIDTHVHPFDVMGIVHYENENQDGNKAEEDYFKPGMMERLKFNALANFLSKTCFDFLPKVIISEIKSLYNNVYEKRILDEMEQSLVDKIVLLPIEPWVPTSYVHNYYNNKKFLLLGSLDIHSVRAEEIKEIITRYVSEFNIVGLKLHPNLQNFMPQPSDNSEEIGEKLRIIYKTAEENNLYLLFHGGRSSFTSYRNNKYEEFSRSRGNAVLQNFLNKKGESEIFGKYNVPIIIAHIGHYGLSSINSDLVKFIAEKYNNVYFDTSGVSPKFIKKAIEAAGSRRIILGSDAFYNKMAYSIYFVYQAALKARVKENLDEMMINILSDNFKKILDKEGL